MPKETTDKKPPKRRQKDNNGHYAPAREAMEIFADAITTDRQKGRVTRSAQKAYPNQKRNSAQVTGSRLLSHPKVAQIIQRRLERAAKAANITREQVMGLTAEMTSISLFDIVDDSGCLDIKKAKAKGIDHLISEIDITERTSNNGSMRRTIKYKINNKLQAIDLLSDLRGWKKEPAKNPASAAQEDYAIMRADPDYADIPNEELAKLQADIYKVTVPEILAAGR